MTHVAHNIPALQAHIDASLEAYQSATPESGVVHGVNILRWFLKGWVSHPDTTVQNDLMLFQYARDHEGNHIHENSQKGYALLRAAKRGELIRTL